MYEYILILLDSRDITWNLSIHNVNKAYNAILHCNIENVTIIHICKLLV